MYLIGWRLGAMIQQLYHIPWRYTIYLGGVLYTCKAKLPTPVVQGPECVSCRNNVMPVST